MKDNITPEGKKGHIKQTKEHRSRERGFINPCLQKTNKQEPYGGDPMTQGGWKAETTKRGNVGQQKKPPIFETPQRKSVG